MRAAEAVSAGVTGERRAASVVDVPSIEDVYAEHARAIFNYLCFQAGDPVAADELLSVVFERVVRSLHRFDPRRGPLRPWLYTIVRNAVRNHRRGSRPAAGGVDAVPSREPGPEEQAVRRESQRELVALVAGLPRREREVIGLKFSAGLSNRSIAEVMGIRDGHVAVILHRAIRRLRAELRGGEGS